MRPLTIQQIRQAVGGRALSALPEDAPLITAVSTNSRQIESGSLFVAIKGDRLNGHNFLPDAAASGAIAALIEEPPQQKLPNLHLIHVDSTRVALGKLATHVRKKLQSKVIAVAGSNGKTTTKYFIDSVLSAS